MVFKPDQTFTKIRYKEQPGVSSKKISEEDKQILNLAITMEKKYLEFYSNLKKKTTNEVLSSILDTAFVNGEEILRKLEDYIKRLS